MSKGWLTVALRVFTPWLIPPRLVSNRDQENWNWAPVGSSQLTVGDMLIVDPVWPAPKSASALPVSSAVGRKRARATNKSNFSATRVI
ncbi:MAG: hypothetical protein ABI056_03315 [Caulobacteraceae bacterium]